MGPKTSSDRQGSGDDVSALCEDVWLHGFDETSVNHVAAVERYRFFAQDVAGRAVLDAASGPGFGVRAIVEAGADHVTAVDLSEAALAQVPVNAPSDRVTCVRADVTCLPFDAASFDVVVSSETLEHVPDWRGYFRELKRVLKPDGVFWVSTPNRPVCSPFRLRPAAPRHVREVSIGGFACLLRRHFREVALYGQRFVRRGDVLRGVRAFFNAWTPEVLQGMIKLVKRRLASAGAAGARQTKIDPANCRVTPLSRRPGWAPTWSVARCCGPMSG